MKLSRKKRDGKLKKKRQGSNSARRNKNVGHDAEEMKNILDDYKDSIYNDILITKIDDITQESSLISIENLDNDERELHFQSMETKLDVCKHCRVLRQEKQIPKCLMALHVYICHSTMEDKNALNDLD